MRSRVACCHESQCRLGKRKCGCRRLSCRFVDFGYGFRDGEGRLPMTTLTMKMMPMTAMMTTVTATVVVMVVSAER